VLPHIFIGYSARGSVPLYPLTITPLYYTTPVYTEIKDRGKGAVTSACFSPGMSHYLPGILLAILLATRLQNTITCTHITAGIHAATLTPYGAFTAMHNDHSGLLICNISSVLFAAFMPPN